MKLKSIALSVVSMPLKKPFTTHLQTVAEREGIIIEAVDLEGITGLGECVAFSTPWYTEETVKGAYHILKDVLIPLLLKADLRHPEECGRLFSGVRGNAMAKASLEMAIWDLYARQSGQPLWAVIGGTRQEVLAGAVVPAGNMGEMVKRTSELMEEGYGRIKIKISPGEDEGIVRELRRTFPDLPLMADANSAYTLHDLPALQKLDRYGLLMIEQPLGVDDIVEHSMLQKELSTPVCLDESIVSPHDMKSAIALQACGVVNIKLGRVGGYSQALDIYHQCLESGLSVWCGGMIEFGVSRAHNIVLSTLEGFNLPGDLSSSATYWEQDLITEPITVQHGRILRKNGVGIGVELDQRRMKEITFHKEIITE
ncbi:O-succinylbenzoate synthase [Rossellomorea marisflavi]|uniref:o-succinylbenzoate synthase n=1 Tax=Rossellomorea marisflavi TaxID=189381 RepID=A0A0M0GMD6_9BACI|nr:o-succinylbenzoate synthase [Rossellomorea marisflavi]KON90994.1 O-succinylbenzoate synthase [Rossellomorea marisflavi]